MKSDGMNFTKAEYEALCDTSELAVYEEINARLIKAYEALRLIQTEQAEFVEAWKTEYWAHTWDNCEPDCSRCAKE